MDVDRKCLYVKGLADSTTANDMRPVFETVGPVITVKKVSPATAIVSYPHEDHAQNAIDRLHGSEIDGRLIQVELKKRKTNPRINANQPNQSGAYGSSEFSKTVSVELHVLLYISANQTTKRTLTNLKAHAKINLKNSCISVQGDKHHVEEATKEIQQLVSSLPVSTCDASDVFRQCFRKISHSEIVGVFKSKHIIAGWDLHDGQLYTCSNSVQSASRSIELIQDMILEMTYPTNRELSAAQINLIADSSWLELRDRLKEEYTTKSLEIDYNHALKKVVIALRSSGNSGAVILSLERFFDPVTSRNITIALSKKESELFTKNKKYIQRQCSPEGVTIDFSHLSLSRQCVIESSSDELLAAAATKVRAILKQCSEVNTSFTKISAVEWLKSPTGRNKMKDITSLTPTVADVETKRVKQRDRIETSEVAGRVQAVTGASSVTDQVKPDFARRVKVIQGDITAVGADGLISCHGAVAKAIRNKYGVSLKEGSSVKCSYEGKKVCVFHIHLDEWDGSQGSALLDNLCNQIKKAYRCLSLFGVKDIAIPAIGTGGLRYPPDLVASCIFKTLKSCLNDDSEQRVHLVIHPQDNVHKVFEDELQKYQPKPAPRAVATPSITKAFTEQLTVTFTGLKDSDVREALSKLKEEIKHSITTHCWGDLPSDKTLVMKLTPDEVSRIHTKALNMNVDADIEVENGSIVLEGIKDHVDTVKEFVNNILRDKPSSASHAAFPPHWDQGALAKGQHEVKLDRYSAEFSKVGCKFFETCQITGIQISEIMRIQNEHLYTQYQAQKSKIQKELSGDEAIEVERELWHGTTAESVKQICANEFNRSFAGAHGMTYGQGSYFSTTTQYSITYSDGQVDKYMILAKVATGRYQRGTRETQRKNLPPGIHSTVNSRSNPSIFVVYHDASAYPEYVIKFNRKSEHSVNF